MFVINANASWSASATAYATGSGGNTVVTSASWYYDIPMNGSTYNMFESRSRCANCYNHATWTYNWRNGNNPDSSSVISYAKAINFDQDVLFPNNETTTAMWEHPFVDQFIFCWQKEFWEHNLDEIVEMDLGETPAINYSTVISRKKFDGWEKIGKSINTYMWLCRTNGSYLAAYQCPTNWNTTSWCTHAAHKCPITHYIDFWLLHTDGTKTIIQKKEITLPYYKLENDLSCTKLWGDSEVIFSCAQYFQQIFNWECINTPVTACSWDRLYLEKWTCPICWLYDVHTSTKTWTWSQNYGTYWCCCSHSFMTFGNTYTHNSNYMCTSICNTSKTERFNWIQFSIE